MSEADVAGDPSVVPLTRRERLRAATLTEIKDVARRHVTEGGAANLSLRAISRDLGMSAPALYRYYDSRDALLSDLLVDCFTSLAEALEAARDDQPADDTAGRLAAAALAYRDWSLTHPAEFTLVFGAPVPGYTAPEDGPTQEAGERFGMVFLELIVLTWMERRFAVDEPGDLEPGLVAALGSCTTSYGLPSEVPLGVLALWLQGWGHLHGLISLEVFGHLGHVVPDGGGLFRAEVRAILDRMDLPPPTWLPR
jgi:AcrR family transcriptional regulator